MGFLASELIPLPCSWFPGFLLNQVFRSVVLKLIGKTARRQAAALHSIASLRLRTEAMSRSCNPRTSSLVNPISG